MTSAERKKLKDKSKVDLICIDCGASYQISFGQYRKNLNKGREDRCAKCRRLHQAELLSDYHKNLDPKTKAEQAKKMSIKSKAYIDSLSEEERKNRIDNMVDRRMKKMEEDEEFRLQWAQQRKDWFDNQTEERKEEIRNKLRNIYPNLTDEQKEIIKQKQRDRWKNISKEELEGYKIRGKQNWEAKSEEDKYNFINYYSNLSEEEKLKRDKIISEKSIEYWKSLSKDEINRRMEYMRIKAKEWREKLSEAEKRLIRKNQSDKMKENWIKLSNKEKEKRIQRLQNIAKDYWDNMSRDDYDNWNLLKLLGMAESNNENHRYTLTELQFMDILNENNLKYKFQYTSKIKHEDFNDLFEKNVDTVNYVSPYHNWDFKVTCKDGTDILVDIDGSIHDIDKNTTITTRFGDKLFLRDILDYNESKRPYQTDNMDAYVIKCYNDFINEETVIQNIKTFELFTLEEFINLITFTEEDFKLSKN